MTEQEFETLAELIGPRDGAVRNALWAYYVLGLQQVEAAEKAGIKRGPMSRYVKKWNSALTLLSKHDWCVIIKKVTMQH